MNKKRAFTLIEVMIVMVIITALVIIAIAFLRTQVLKGNDARRKADTRRIGIATEEYEKDNNCYPLSSLVVCHPGDGLNPYLDKIPCDPVKETSYYYEHEDAICPSWYRIYADLDNENDTDYQSGIGPGESFSYVYQSSNAPEMTSNGGEGIPATDYYGCFSGACVMIQWDVERPGPECDPNYQNYTCYDECSNPANECQSWGI